MCHSLQLERVKRKVTTITPWSEVPNQKGTLLSLGSAACLLRGLVTSLKSMCGLGYHGFTSSAPENCAPGPRKGADPLVLISPQPSSVLPSRTEQMLHDLFRVEGLLTENPRTRHSQEERTKLDGLTWRKNSPLACFLGPWYAI